MKNPIFKIFFGLFLIFSVCVSIFGQENKDSAQTCNADKNKVKKEEKKDPLNLEDCAPQDYDCKIDYYTEKIAKTEDSEDWCNSCDYYQDRGIAYYEKGDFTNALSDFNFVIKNGRFIGLSSLYRGKIYEKKGNYDSALSDYLKFQSDQGLLGIGNIYRYKREHEKALEYYNKAIVKNYRLSKAYFGRAVIYLELGRILNQKESEEDKTKAIQYFKDALKELDSVIEIDLNYTEAETYLRRSQVYRQLGETEKADADFQKYNELDEAAKIKQF
ncbi:MAG TPA: tetratricopeptide repeat protein [Pyrinomonadaceae bacterium]|nr:tetratricopeptide repeat protein [Pyrinomonadaceae bacterium]